MASNVRHDPTERIVKTSGVTSGFRTADLFAKAARGAAPSPYTQPWRWMKYRATTKPAIFWSCVIGFAGPVLLLVVPPVREMLGDKDPERIPLTYPVPTGPRKQLTGYDDE